MKRAKRRGETPPPSGAPASARITLVTSWARLANALTARLGEVQVIPRLTAVPDTKAELFIIDTRVPDFRRWPAPLVLDPGANSKPWIFLLHGLGDARSLRSLPSDSAFFDRSIEAVDQVVSYVRRRLDPESAKRIASVDYLEKSRAFLVSMEDNRTYVLRLDDLSGTDTSGVTRWVLGRTPHSFKVIQESGNKIEVPWDGVLFHSEPRYEFYRGKQQPGENRARGVGERVRALRTARGLNITQLAERSGMKRPNLSRLESGRHVPSLETLERVARALGVGVTELVASGGGSSGARLSANPSRNSGRDERTSTTLVERDEEEQAPALGERAALAGYVPQYEVAAALLLRALTEENLEWLALLDPTAGRLDDFQVATPGVLDAYQIKWSEAGGQLPWGTLRSHLIDLVRDRRRDRKSVV
jgi:transcriptional regulator with XRE-family HTH domain